MRFEGGSDFVFAFRLREVCYSVKRGEGCCVHEGSAVCVKGRDEE